MGKQIRFFQLESDINAMLAFLRQHNLSVFDLKGNILTQAADICNKSLLAINQKYIPSKIPGGPNPPIEYIVSSKIDTTQTTEAYRYLYDSAICGIKYELIKTGGMIIIQECRFYLANEYYLDDNIVATYKLLKKYIQKNCVYSKDRAAYFSPQSIEEYKKGNVHFAQGQNILPLIDL